MKLISVKKRVVVLALAGVLAASAVGTSYLHAQAANIPTVTTVQTGVKVLSNNKAVVDASNLSEGFVMVKYTGGKNVRIKVQITKSGGTTYTYNLNNTGTYETFPLTEGDGTYSIKVYENTSGTKYSTAYSTSVTMKLRDPFLPFLYSKKGICFDYSAVMAAMLRSQGIPCKLVIGYAGKIYHAWIDVYIQGVGWVKNAIYFDGKNWTLMDPTFVSTGKGSSSIMKYVTTSSNYSAKYAY